MARRTENILFGVTGQKLAERVLSGRPQSATFKVFAEDVGDNSTSPEFSGNCTVDTPNTTVNAESGPSQTDPRRLNLASTAGLRTDRAYQLKENGLVEWVKPLEIFNGYVICRAPLQRVYTAAATLKSTWLELTVDPTWVADETNLSDQLDPDPDYRARLAVLAEDGATEVLYTFFRLVRAGVDHQVDIADITDRWPGLLEQIHRHHKQDQARRIIEGAWRALRWKLQALGLDETGMRDAEGVDEALILWTRVELAAGGIYPPGWDVLGFHRMASVEFDSFFEQNFKVTLKRAVSQGTDGAATSKVAAEAPVWSK